MSVGTRRKHRQEPKRVSRKTLGIFGVAAVTLTAFASAVWAPPSHAVEGFPVVDSGSGTAGETDTNWDIAASSGSDGGTYTSDGWLRLMNGQTNQKTNLLNKTDFSSETAFIADFDYRMAPGIAGSLGTGDGFSFYLTNGTASKSNGGSGSGLAYAQTDVGGGQRGVEGGVLGVGFDAYGGFATAIGSGPSTCPRGGITGSYPNSLAVRGSGDDGCTTSSYPLVYPTTSDGVKATQNPGSSPLVTTSGANGADPATVADSTYRHVRIAITPSTTSGGSPTIDLWISDPKAKDVTDFGALTQVFTSQPLTGVTLPSTLKLGFGSSTGGAAAFVDLRNISISARTAVSLTSNVTSTEPTGGYLPGDTVSISMTAKNLGPSTLVPAGGTSSNSDEWAMMVADLSALDLTTAPDLHGVTSNWANGKSSVSWYAGVDETASVPDLSFEVPAYLAPGTYQIPTFIPTDFTGYGTSSFNPTFNPNISYLTPNMTASSFNLAGNNPTPLEITVGSAPSIVWEAGTTATLSGDFQAGSDVTFTYPFKNTGNVPLSAITVSPTTDGFDGDTSKLSWSCTPATVAAGETGTCTGTYPLQQSDVDQGGVSLTANATGTVSGSDTTTTETPATASITGTATAALELTKTSDSVEQFVAGQDVDYTITVTNTGNGTATDVNVADPGPTGGTGTMGDLSCTIGGVTVALPTSLAPGDPLICTAKYTLSQKDVNEGTLSNTASVTGKGPAVDGGTPPPLESTTEPVVTTPTEGAKATLVYTKTAPTVQKLVAGQDIPYTITVTNTGNGTATNVNVTDAGPTDGTGTMGDLTCTIGGVDTTLPTSLDPGDPLICTANYTLSQADVDKGSLSNTATVTGTDPAAPEESQSLGGSTTPEVTTPTERATAELTYEKTSETVEKFVAGQDVNYTITVTNTGNGTADDVKVSDPGPTDGTGTMGDLTCTIGGVDTTLPTSLAPGDPLICKAAYTLSQEDVNKGTLSNTATVTGTDPAAPEGSQSLGGDTDPQTTTPTERAKAELTYTKTSQAASQFIAGEDVDYTITVTNTGNGTAEDVNVTDAGPTDGTGTMGDLACTIGGVDTTLPTSLDPGDPLICKAAYTLSQEDVNKGTLTNTASVTGTDPAAPEGSQSLGGDTAPEIATPSVPAVATLQLVKTADAPDPFKVGADVTYTFTVTNTGNGSAKNVAVTDPGPTMPDGSSATGTWSGVNCAASGEPASNIIATVDPGIENAKTCTATYTLTQADADAGQLSNIASVTGENPDGTATESVETQPVPAGPGAGQQDASLGMAVTPTNPTAPVEGSDVAFDIVVTNTGDATVSGVNVTVPSGFALSSCSPQLPAELIPTDTISCTATHTLTQAEVDAKSLTLNASAEGQYAGRDITASEQGTATWTLQPSLTLTKTVSDITAADYKAGTAITFTYTVKNDGDATLQTPAIQETNFTGVDANGNSVTLTPCAMPEGNLAPGGTVSCDLEYTLSQGDIDNAVQLTPGPLSNTANATALTLDGQAASSAPSTAVLGTSDGQTISPKAAVTLTQDIGTIAPNTYVAGTEVPFTFTITNSGAVTMDSVEMSYDFGGSGTFSPTCTPALDQPLLPNGSISCTDTYTLTQADVDAQSFMSEATAVGHYGAKTTDPSTAIGVVTGTNTPAVDIVKEATVNGKVEAGATVDYTFTVKNDGPTSIKAVNIIENSFNGQGTEPQVSCPALPDDGLLAPKSSVVCTADYTLVQADLDQGGVANTATATATSVGADSQFSSLNPGSAFVGGNLTPSLSLSGNVTAAGNAAGDKATYTWTVTNTGEITVTGVDVDMSDHFTGTGGAPAVTCEDATLAPGSSTTCTGTYDLTQADVDAGAVSAAASVTGQALQSQISAGPENADLTLNPTTGLLAQTDNVKVSSSDFGAGQQITVPVTVKNTGQTTVTGVGASFTDFGGSAGEPALACDPTSLEPGENADCSFTYTLDQADVDDGGFTFTVEAIGEHSGTAVAQVPISGSVQGNGVFALDLQLSATPIGQADFKAGTPVTFTFDVTNTGKVTALDVEAAATNFTADDTLGSISCDASTLVPGASTTCTAEYTLTQVDVDRPGVTLTGVANATVTHGTGGPSNTAAVTVSQVPVNALGITKTVARAAGAEDDPYNVGDLLDYTFVATNEGNGTLSALTLDESNFSGTGTLGAITCETPAGAGLDPADVTLAPGDAATCSAQYALTQKDLEAEKVTNQVSAGMKWGQADVPPATAAASIHLTVNPVLTLSGTATLEGNQFKAGAPVNIVYELTNGGPIDLTDWTVSQSFSPLARVAGVPAECPNNDQIMAVGDTEQCTYTYLLTQEDVDAGGLQVNAQGTAASVSGDVDANSSVLPEVIEPLDGQLVNALTLTKTASELTSDQFKAGAQVAYTFQAENTGFTTLSAVNVVEGDFTGTGKLENNTCKQQASLAPGATYTCTADYTLTQADVDAGGLSNTASATGTAPIGDALVQAEGSTAVTKVKPLAGLKLTKTVAPVKGADFKSGTKVEYKFLVENVGNVTVGDVVVNEGKFTGTGKLSDVTCPEQAAQLAPGANMTCTASYTLTDADAKAGKISNTASVDGKLPNGDSLAGSDSVAFEVVSPEGGESTAVLKPTGPLAVTGMAAGVLLLLAGGALSVGLWTRRKAKKA